MEIEDKLILAKFMDKVRTCKTKNKIVNSEFLTVYQREIIGKELGKLKIRNYFFFGGYDEAEGECIIIYPEKLGVEIAKTNLDNIIKTIKIELPKELYGKYSHRDYLGAVMQTGLNRNRIGDIIVHDKKAYVIVLEENAKYIANYLQSLTRFRKSKIEIINCNDIELKEKQFEELKISVSSMRLDNIVSEIARISRGKASILLNEEKIFVNSKCETKATKIIKQSDVLVIRSRGKFIIDKIGDINSKGKTIIYIKQYK